MTRSFPTNSTTDSTRLPAPGVFPRRLSAFGIALLANAAGLATAGGCAGEQPQSSKSSAAMMQPVIIHEVPANSEPVIELPGTELRHAGYPQGHAGYPRVPGVNEPAGTDASLEDSTSTTQVTFAEEGGAFDPAVSRDGSFLVFSSTQHRPTADIYLKPIRGRALTQLTSDPADDIMPALSPDGARVAFASNRGGNWDIYVMPATGGSAVQITSDAGQDIHPSWSPDGSELVFCRLGETSGRWELWTVKPEASGVSRFIGFGMFPTWCPVPATGQNGFDRIAFQLGRERGNRAFGLWTIDYRDGQVGALTQIDSSTDEALVNPAWSPDGERLVFTSMPALGNGHAAARPSSGQLWMIDADGSNRVRLTAGTRSASSPVWTTPTQLLFVSDRSGIENIWSIDMANPVLAASHAKHPSSMPTAHAPQSKSPDTHASDAHASEAHADEHTQPASHADAGSGHE